MAYQKWGTTIRKTFLDWAKEVLEMKNQMEIDRVGLGTDGGGHLPELIDGYKDVRDLVHLIELCKRLVFPAMKFQLIWAEIPTGISNAVSVNLPEVAKVRIRLPRQGQIEQRSLPEFPITT